jgi:hypothetical protein
VLAARGGEGWPGSRAATESTARWLRSCARTALPVSPRAGARSRACKARAHQPGSRVAFLQSAAWPERACVGCAHGEAAALCFYLPSGPPRSKCASAQGQLLAQQLLRQRALYTGLHVGLCCRQRSPMLCIVTPADRYAQSEASRHTPGAASTCAAQPMTVSGTIAAAAEASLVRLHACCATQTKGRSEGPLPPHEHSQRRRLERTAHRHDRKAT